MPRGSTTDLRIGGPGPLLRGPGEPGEALGDLPGAPAAWVGRCAASRERWCSPEDGRATDRVLEGFVGLPAAVGAHAAAGGR